MKGTGALIIIKRKKAGGGEAKHAGAWKVAIGQVLSWWRVLRRWFRDATPGGPGADMVERSF